MYRRIPGTAEGTIDIEIEKDIAPMESAPEAQPLMELVASLEHATLMAKRLPSTTDHSQILQVCSSFQNAHNHLVSFLARFHSSQPLLAGDNSVSSAFGEDEPMQVGDDEEIEAEAEGEVEVEVEENSMTVNKVEERMRDFVLQNKRRKRRLSPSSIVPADQRPSYDNGSVLEQPSFDPREARQRSLDLVFQFHG
ncbi:uncharacterized protein LOC122081295 [Macadamia integrifolia]|uniref:uncharacterized protein LOC122081295 n=1 Tax=Macadamia integrifolia TaxID=60698 RepID=UPI001C4F33CF|nr:uncharacterized protein LOC122081295 [Macadamia integrifolia]